MNLPDSIDLAARHIREGRLVAFPTETVYGLGANALNALAVARIYDLKDRPAFDPLIVHVASMEQLEELVSGPDERIRRLADRFWPGPLTMVLPRSPLVPDIVTSGLSTVGIRMPDNETALALIRQSACPIAAPSANKFGRISPTSAAHVRKQLPGVDYILDGGKTSVGIESTIVRLTPVGFQLLRRGIITPEELETVVPRDRSSSTEAVSAPGMLHSHYRPGKHFLIAREGAAAEEKERAGLISFSGALEPGYRKVIRVSETGDLKEYAVHLFEAMHTFEDDEDIELIRAEPVCDKGIGKAIMDRLRKAEFHWRHRSPPA
jgi:L-threonylcarbamoyladenylate synthase